MEFVRTSSYRQGPFAAPPRRRPLEPEHEAEVDAEDRPAVDVLGRGEWLGQARGPGGTEPRIGVVLEHIGDQVELDVPEHVVASHAAPARVLAATRAVADHPEQT